MKENFLNQYFIGDCVAMLREHVPDNSVDLVVTSPPYAQQRQDQYGGIPEKDYPYWTVDWMTEVHRVLKDSGSALINIRPHIKNGQISDYMLRTRIALRDAGWIEAEELIWIKPTAPALGSLNRPRRSWESIHWFSKTPTPFVNLTAKGRKSKRIGLNTNKGVGEYINSTSEGAEEGVSRVKDYVEFGTHLNDRDKDNTHPAQYPVELVEWLIDTFCPKDGVVLDPFLGSGTTAVAAQKLKRQWIGCELNPEYKDIISKRIKEKHQEIHEGWYSI